MIEMSVIGVTHDQRTERFVVVLVDATNVKGLPIWIGRAEAKAISFALAGGKSVRPLTYSLFANLLELFDYEVQHIEIDALEYAYKATIVMNCKSDKTSKKFLDARPSDAIAIALTAKAPILVSSELEFVIDSETQLDLSFREFVRDLKASDFNSCASRADSSVDPNSLKDEAENASDRAEEET